MSTVAPDEIVLTSKLTAPPVHAQAIRRLRLERLITTGTERRLTLVVAPAGYGKTTVVSTWASMHVGPLAWISLDRDDNNPTRFWTYVTVALARAGVALPAVGEAVGRLDRLSNTLAALEHDVVLVLDDYFLIVDPEIHADLGRLLEQRLPHLHVVMVSRADPPFVQARWKAHGDVAEVRAQHLAFTEDEMEMLLDDESVVLADDVRSALFAKVNGWPAALRLATVWVANHPDQTSAVVEFASSDATIADYLVSEVLGQLPGQTRRFLLLTSVLPWLSGPLCDAVTGGSEGARVLADLESRDLFIQAVDPSHGRFRYHPLFGELLSNELRRANPDDRAGLHIAAATWLAAHGHSQDAIDQSIAGADWPVVGRLLLGETLAIGSGYQLSIVDRWLGALPIEVRDRSPLFLLLLGFVLGSQGRTGDAGQVLDRAKGLAAAAPVGAVPHELVALIHAVDTGVARLEGDLARATATAAAVEVELDKVGQAGSPLGPMARIVAANSLAAAHIWEGELDVATSLLDSIKEQAQGHALDRMEISERGSRSLVLALHGRLREAESVAGEALDRAAALGIAELFPLNSALLARAIVSMQHDSADEALDQLAVLTDRTRRHGDRAPFVHAAVQTARLHGVRGDHDAAFAVLDAAKVVWVDWTLPPLLAAILLTEEARLLLRLGDLRAARVALADLNVPGTTPARLVHQRLTEGRVLHASGRYHDAAKVLSTLAADPQALPWLLIRVTALVETAVALRAANDTQGALVHLDQALGLAQLEGITTPFTWSAETIRPLLMQMDHADRDFGRLGLRQRLLARMGVPSTVVLRRPTHSDQPDQLSDRELTVLRLLRGTMRNAEIAAALDISPNTLKTHIRNIHRKLGTQNRPEAVARAESLDPVRDRGAHPR